MTSRQPVAILASGMVTGVGFTSASTCAAIRCAIANFTETRFMDKGGEWIIGAQVPLEGPWRGRAKLVKMVVPAIRECLASLDGIPPTKVPLFLCVAEPDRPGRLDGLDQTLLVEVQVELGAKFHPNSKVIPGGKVGGANALALARQWLQGLRGDYCIIAGVDSYLVGGTLAAYEEHTRVLTSVNHDGFIPGEAGAAVVVGLPGKARGVGIHCLGIGQGQEQATMLSEQPLKADGLVMAIKHALADAGCSMGDLDFRITDLSGEQYGFKEASLALTRTLRQRKEHFYIWHPADCIGEVGAAIVPVMLGVFLTSTRKNYSLGSMVLCHGANDGVERMALVMKQVA
jgi:3-oxoacyl-[acyl-carrier-protein] synthase-1